MFIQNNRTACELLPFVVWYLAVELVHWFGTHMMWSEPKISRTVIRSRKSLKEETRNTWSVRDNCSSSAAVSVMTGLEIRSNLTLALFGWEDRTKALAVKHMRIMKRLSFILFVTATQKFIFSAAKKICVKNKNSRFGTFTEVTPNQKTCRWWI